MLDWFAYQFEARATQLLIQHRTITKHQNFSFYDSLKSEQKQINTAGWKVHVEEGRFSDAASLTHLVLL